jgi:hypothetical protein
MSVRYLADYPGHMANRLTFRPTVRNLVLQRRGGQQCSVISAVRDWLSENAQRWQFKRRSAERLRAFCASRN